MVALIIIYNHRFDSNIPKLEKIYENRFSTIYHLVPFYDGDLPHVIPVFENSFYFQGYIPQSNHILNKINASHFVFVGDDLILHPDINENNILSELKVSEDGAFLPWLWGFVDQMSLEYANSIPAINSFDSEKLFLHHSPNWRKILPSKDIMLNKLESFDLKTDCKLKFRKIFGEDKFLHNRWKKTFQFYLNRLVKNKLELEYPLIAGYSDFFIVCKDNLNHFSELCELFRQMRLWVEFAIPLAIFISHENIVFETDSIWKGKTYWDKIWKGTFYNPHTNLPNVNLNSRLSRVEEIEDIPKVFESKELYIHPIKLSKYKL